MISQVLPGYIQTSKFALNIIIMNTIIFAFVKFSKKFVLRIQQLKTQMYIIVISSVFSWYTTSKRNLRTTMK